MLQRSKGRTLRKIGGKSEGFLWLDAARLTLRGAEDALQHLDHVVIDVRLSRSPRPGDVERADAVPFEELLPGTYDSASPPESLAADSPRLYAKIEELQHLIERYGIPALAPNVRLNEGHGVVTIEDWVLAEQNQPLLRKITLSVQWVNEAGEPRSSDKVVFVHPDAIYSRE